METAKRPAAEMWTLYRFFDAEGGLLYIGQTAGAGVRFTEHRRRRDWWATVARIDVEHFSDRTSAVDAERLAIKTEKPRHNIQHCAGTSAAPVYGRVYSERHERRLRRGL